MKGILLFIVLIAGLASVQGQDYYSKQQRADWLRKAEASKPALQSVRKYPVSIVNIVQDKTAFQGEKAVRQSNVGTFYIKPLHTQSGAVIDFGEHLTGYVSFVVKPLGRTPDAPARIKFTFGEVPAELATPFDPYPGGLSRAWLQDETLTLMTIPDTILISRRVAFRYVKIELVANPNYDFAVSELFCDAVSSATSAPEPLPESVSPVIREIDRIGLATLKECMQTVYEDGPKRDQRLWIGDLYLEALANAYSYKNHALTKRCLYLLAALADESGFLNATVFEKPSPHPQARQLLLDYAFLYNVALKNYLEITGDKQTAEDLWPVAKKQLEIANAYLQENGLMDYEKANREWWIFFDWCDGLHKEVALQGITIFAFRQTYELANLLGKTNELADVPLKIKQMTAAAHKYFYDKKTGFFVGIRDKQRSYVSQIWMTLSGVACPKEARRALKMLETAEGVVKTGAPYAYHYYIQALIDCGLTAEAKTALINYWGDMVKKGADTFWEVYSPGNDWLSPYGFHPVNSYCHAWSCTPVYFIRKYKELFY